MNGMVEFEGLAKGEQIFINPLQVIGIRPWRKGAVVICAGDRRFFVRATPDEAAEDLSAQLRYLHGAA